MKRARGFLAVLAVGAAAMFSMSPAQAYLVQVGYADGLRGGVNFPNPWFGDAGVHFFGFFNPPNDAGADAGAVRIVNDGGLPITITTMNVDTFENGASFTLWNAFLPAVLLPGESAVFTETAFNNFDTSDQPIHGAPGSTDQPQVHVTVDGVLSSFTDVGQVLNTGGFDLAQTGRSEALGWRDIASTCGINCPGNQIPEPASLGLVGLALAGFGALRRRARR